MEAELERSRFESEQKTRELKLQKEMAMTRAELAVYEQFDADELDRPDVSRPDVTFCSSFMPSGQQSSPTSQTQLFTPPVSAGVYRPETTTSVLPCRQSSLTCQIPKFCKFKMADGRHMENRLLAISR